MKLCKKRIKLKFMAFTMAEAILVMTILGIIATIMITTLKPSQFKDKGLKILYKKILAELDTATTQILIKNSATGKMNSLFLDNESTTFTFNSDLTKTTKLYKKYLASTRKQYDTTKNLGTFSEIVQQSSTSATLSPPFYLKDGALIFLGAGEKYQLDPSLNATINAENCEMPQSLLGIIVIDINGEDEPNAMYKDQFLLPIGKDGIEYESMCQTIELANATPTPDPTPTPTPTPDPEPEEEEPADDGTVELPEELFQSALEEFQFHFQFNHNSSVSGDCSFDTSGWTQIEYDNQPAYIKEVCGIVIDCCYDVGYGYVCSYCSNTLEDCLQIYN